MKSIVPLLLATIGGVVALSACKEDGPAPAAESIPIIFPEINPEKSFFNYDSVRRAGRLVRNRPVFEFTFAPHDQRDIDLATVELYKSYGRYDLGTQTTKYLGPRVKIGDYSTFPATVTLTSDEALQGLQRIIGADSVLTLALPANAQTANNFQINLNDRIIFTFEYVLKNGERRILTPYITKKYADGDKQIIRSTATLASSSPTANYPFVAAAVFRKP